MKKSLKAIFFISGLLLSFQAFSYELPCSKADKSKDIEFISYCANLVSCSSTYNTTDSKSNLLKVKQIPFSPMRLTATGSTESDPINIYKGFLSELGSKEGESQAQLGGSGPSGGNFGIGPLEQAKFVYLETQNAIYNCAVLQTKIKVTESILKYVKSSSTSNIKTKLESQIKSLNTEKGKRKCNKAPSEVNISYKEILLKGITFNYCNYRFYLSYLANFPQYNVSAPPVSGKLQTPGEKKISLSKIATNLTKQSDIVDKEVRHSKQVYNQSFSAFAEFENTYGLHVMLLFIEDDYILLRKNLSKLLSPISQLAYKIPQAQKK